MQNRSDEMISIKTECDSIQQSNLLQTVNTIATGLIMASPDVFKQVINESLQTLGEAVGVHRTYIWQNFEQDGQLFCRQTYEWSEGAEPQQGKDFTVFGDYENVPFWKESVLSGRIINGPIKNLPDAEREVLQLQDIVSVLIIPIIHAGQPWGFIGFDDCENERYFSGTEEQVLQSGGILMVCTILRNNITQNLITARNELHEQDILLRAVNSAAALLMEDNPEQFGDIIIKALQIMGESVGMDSAYIWKNGMQNDQLCCFQIAEWTGNGISAYDESSTKHIIYDNVIPNWQEMVKTRKALNSYVSDLKVTMPNLPVTDDVISIAILPVILQGEFWGFIGFDNCHRECLMEDSQIDILKSGGMLIASAFMRNEMTSSLIEAKENALTSMRAKSEFLSRMSHEIRTPMNAIIGMTAIAQKSDDLVKIQYCLDKVDSFSNQLLSIINDVLDMSKIDANKFEIINSEFDFEKMIRNVFNIIQVKAEEKHQNFQVDFQQVFSRNMISDELRLSQVLLNLLSNAIKFTPDGGTIRLYMQETPINYECSSLHFEITDTGIGVTAERIPHLFKSFEQADGGITRQYGGSGLGLAICKKIINLMHGEIWVKSVPGKGTAFFFEINVGWGTKLADRTKNTIENDRNVNKNIIPDWSDKQLLLVEDVDINSEIIINILEKTRIAIDCARDGKQAVEMYQTAPFKYDLILMDIQMPVLDGLAATRQIRTSGLPGCDTIQILAMTANAFKEDEYECLAAGMNAHITKPIKIDLLYETLTRCLNNC